MIETTIIIISTFLFVASELLPKIKLCCEKINNDKQDEETKQICSVHELLFYGLQKSKRNLFLNKQE